MIVCVSSFCRREWDASSGPCAYAREGEESYDEEHRVLVFVVIVVLVAVVLVRRVEQRSMMTKTRRAAHSLSSNSQTSIVVAPALVSVPSMLQGLASRTVRLISRVHPRPINALSRPVLLPLVSGGYAPTTPSVRHYAQTPPGGQGPGGGGGFPGFKLPMQQQYEKGDALKEFVRTLLGVFFKCAFPHLFFHALLL